MFGKMSLSFMWVIAKNGKPLKLKNIPEIGYCILTKGKLSVRDIQRLNQNLVKIRFHTEYCGIKTWCVSKGYAFSLRRQN